MKLAIDNLNANQVKILSCSLLADVILIKKWEREEMKSCNKWTWCSHHDCYRSCMFVCVMYDWHLQLKNHPPNWNNHQNNKKKKNFTQTHERWISCERRMIMFCSWLVSKLERYKIELQFKSKSKRKVAPFFLWTLPDITSNVIRDKMHRSIWPKWKNVNFKIIVCVCIYISSITSFELHILSLMKTNGSCDV